MDIEILASKYDLGVPDKGYIDIFHKDVIQIDTQKVGHLYFA